MPVIFDLDSTVVAVSAYVGSTRLIDDVVLRP
jgi:pantothenate synthetase